MMTNIHQSLRDTYSELQQAQKVDRHLSQVNEQLEFAFKNLSTLEAKLQKEFRDIEQLEKLSVKGLFHQVLGSKEAQIEKERQEYLQASLKYDEAKKTSDLLEYERSLLENKVQNIPKLQTRLNSLIKIREKEIIAENSLISKQVLDMLKMIDAQQHFAQLVADVQQTGKDAILVLEKMIRHLQKAKNWGQWDMAGRQRGASFMKHSSIDQARDLSYSTQHLLVRFEKDLQQIYGEEQFNFNIQLESFSRFTDIFFDNLISDWIVQRKIQNALNNVLTVRDRVLRILQSLDAEIVKAETQAAALEDQRKQLIIES